MKTIETPRLRLRPFRPDDLDALSALTANADFMRFSSGAFSRAETAQFLDKMCDRDRNGIPSQFAVSLREENRLLGYCGFFLQDVDGTEETEIAYRLDPEYWGRGLATEAARSVRDHAFHDLHLHRVISLVHPENVASRRVAEKNGMQAERETVFRGFPAIVFGINRPQKNGA